MDVSTSAMYEEDAGALSKSISSADFSIVDLLQVNDTSNAGYKVEHGRLSIGSLH